MSAVMYRPDKIMKSGTWADPDFNGALAYNANGRTAVIDMNQPSPPWRETAPMAYPRSYHNLTLLPDGTVLASGGGTISDGVDLTRPSCRPRSGTRTRRRGRPSPPCRADACTTRRRCCCRTAAC